jgi:hypothetical protein
MVASFPHFAEFIQTVSLRSIFRRALSSSAVERARGSVQCTDNAELRRSVAYLAYQAVSLLPGTHGCLFLSIGFQYTAGGGVGEVIFAKMHLDVTGNREHNL